MPSNKPGSYKPSKDEILASVGKTVPDVIAPDLRVLFCGINPGLYSAAVSHHFARPGNRFWKTLYAAGFSDRLLTAAEELTLLELGYGITNIVDRATATADELSASELVAGRQALADKVKRYQPRFVAVLGIGAYRTAFQQPKATIGRQQETLHGSILWVLPNPSGLNAHYQPKDLAQIFHNLRTEVDRRLKPA